MYERVECCPYAGFVLYTLLQKYVVQKIFSFPALCSPPAAPCRPRYTPAQGSTWAPVTSSSRVCTAFLRCRHTPAASLRGRSPPGDTPQQGTGYMPGPQGSRSRSRAPWGERLGRRSCQCLVRRGALSGRRSCPRHVRHGRHGGLRGGPRDGLRGGLRGADGVLRRPVRSLGPRGPSREGGGG